MRNGKRAAIVVCMLCAAGAARAVDWNQWRGPDRGGVVPETPALAETWPEQGLQQVWQSEKMPGGDNGGYGSVSIVGDKAYVFVAWKYVEPVETRTLKEKSLQGLGWNKTELPVDLREKVEQARCSEEREKTEKKQLRAWVEKWQKDNLDEAQKKKFGGIARNRLLEGKQGIDWPVILKLAEIKDKELANQGELDKWLADNQIPEDVQKRVQKAVTKTREFAQDTIICLNTSDGKTLWKKEYPGVIRGNGASATPCVVDGMCYTMGTDGMVYCHDAQDGKEIWKRQEGKGERNSSPIVVEGMVVCYAGCLSAFQAKTGEVAWQQKKVPGGNNSPMVWKTGERSLLICNTGKGVFCVDPKDGNVLWQCPGGGNSTPAISGDYMVILNNSLIAYKMTAEKAEKLWQCELKDRGASPLIHKGHVYAVAKGAVMCVELETGKEMWREKVPSLEIASPVLADDKIIALASKGLMLVRASPEKCQVLAKTKCRVASCSSPALTDGRLYLRMPDGVGCFDIRASGQ